VLLGKERVKNEDFMTIQLPIIIANWNGQRLLPNDLKVLSKIRLAFHVKFS